VLPDRGGPVDAGRDDDVEAQADQLGRQVRQSLVPSISEAVLQAEVLSLDVAQLA